MKKHIKWVKPIIFIPILLAQLIIFGPNMASLAKSSPQPFSKVSIILEQNASDGDTEAVLFVKGQDEGLKELKVYSPDGERILKFKANPDTIGIREFHLESAEPQDLHLVLQSFPEGDYEIESKTITGGQLKGIATLSHQIASQTDILTPPKQTTVSPDRVTLAWEKVLDAEYYIIEIQNENTEKSLSLELPSSINTFDVPSSWLERDTEYQISIGVQNHFSNITYVESTFYTAS